MALKNFLHKRSGSDADGAIDDGGVGDPSPPRDGVTAIAHVVPRTPTTVIGTIVTAHVVRKAGAPWLEVTIDDGTAKLVAMWSGRREIAGITEGQRLLLTGRAAPSGPGGRLLLYNPRYELI